MGVDDNTTPTLRKSRIPRAPVRYARASPPPRRSRSPRMIATTTRSCSAWDFASRPRLRNWARRNGCTRTRVASVISAMIAVLRAGIDRVVEALVDLVKAVGIAGMDQHPQFLVDRLQHVPLGRRHALGGKAGAQGFESRPSPRTCRSAVRSRPRHHGAAMRPRIDQAAGRELAQRLAHRGARDVEARARCRSRRAPRPAPARRARSHRRAAAAVPRRA